MPAKPKAPSPRRKSVPRKSKPKSKAKPQPRPKKPRIAVKRRTFGDEEYEPAHAVAYPDGPLKKGNPIPYIPPEPGVSVVAPKREELIRLIAGLSPQQKIYFESRMAGGSVAASAQAAGANHPETRGRPQFENNPSIRTAMQVATALVAHNAIIGRSQVLEGLLDSTRMAANSAELTAAWREIGKIIGAYEPVKMEMTFSAQDLDAKRMATMTTHHLEQLMLQRGPALEVASEDDALDAEYETLRTALEPPKPLEDAP